MTCEIYDYRGSAHAHVMRMIAFGSYISQLDNNNTCVSGSVTGKAQIKVQHFRIKVTFYLLQVPFRGVIVFYAFLERITIRWIALSTFRTIGFSSLQS